MEKDPGKKTRKGGAREGSGRKAVSDMYTKTMRVPTVMEEGVSPTFCTKVTLR